MRTVGAVSFDLDGTLCDHKEAVQRSFDATLRAMESLVAGVPAADVRRCFASVGSRLKRSADEAGKPWWPVRDQWADTLREIGVVCSADELDQVTEVFTRTLNDTVIVFPGARRALTAVRRTGLPVGVLTNGDRETQMRKLRACGLAGLVDQVVVSGDLGVHKPDAGAFRAVAHALGVPLPALVHVGDDLVHDVHGAVAAGAWAVWVSPGGAPGRGPATAPGFPGLRAFELEAVPALLEQSRHSP